MGFVKRLKDDNYTAVWYHETTNGGTELPDMAASLALQYAFFRCHLAADCSRPVIAKISNEQEHEQVQEHEHEQVQPWFRREQKPQKATWYVRGQGHSTEQKPQKATKFAKSMQEWQFFRDMLATSKATSKFAK